MLTLSPVGALFILPFELRDRIYKLALNFNESRNNIPGCHSVGCCNFEPIPRTALLRVSRRIHDEAKVSMYQVNEFTFWVSRDTLARPKNRSIMGRAGYTILFGHNQIYAESLSGRWFDIPMDMLPYLQNVGLHIGTAEGVREYDVVPTERQTTSGPERPTFIPLLTNVENACELLKKCKNIHKFQLCVRSIEKTPGNVQLILDILSKLRGIKGVHVRVSSMHEGHWVDWKLNPSYEQYLHDILGMPEGAVAPKYVDTAKESDDDEDKIFKKIGGYWMGGDEYDIPEQGSEDEENDDEEDEFNHPGMFMDPWAVPFDYDEYDEMEENHFLPPFHPLFPGIPPPFPLPHPPTGDWFENDEMDSDPDEDTEHSEDDEDIESSEDDEDDDDAMPGLIPLAALLGETERGEDEDDGSNEGMPDLLDVD